MNKLFTPTTVNKIIQDHNFKFSKSLGQNFLIDEHIIEKIISASDITKDDLVIEIGPGIGTLTAAIAEKAGRVKAVEIDKKLIPILTETLENFDNVEIINEDILKTDLKQIIDNESKYAAIKIIGNLPYYITTPIIMHILESKLPIKNITIMIQKEVADRMKASPGGKEFGALSVAVQYYCEIVPVTVVPKTVFIPKPNVDSFIIRLDIREKPAVDVLDEGFFFKIVRASFSQRRKTLLNSLSSALKCSKESLEESLVNCDIEPKRRAETLSLTEFARLANELYKNLK